MDGYLSWVGMLWIINDRFDALLMMDVCGRRYGGFEVLRAPVYTWVDM